MKERKCHKCRLSYKGLKERCPFCHKLTKIGIFNKIMCVLGYLTLAFILYIFANFLVADAIFNAIWFMPIIAGIIIIAIIVGICIFIFK